MWLRVSITSSKISPKQTYGVSSVTLCLLLITHSLPVFVTLAHTQQVEPPDNQNQPWPGACDVDEKVDKGKVAEGTCSMMGSDVTRGVN